MKTQLSALVLVVGILGSQASFAMAKKSRAFQFAPLAIDDIRVNEAVTLRADDGKMITIAAHQEHEIAKIVPADDDAGKGSIKIITAAGASATILLNRGIGVGTYDDADINADNYDTTVAAQPIAIAARLDQVIADAPTISHSVESCIINTYVQVCTRVAPEVVKCEDRPATQSGHQNVTSEYQAPYREIRSLAIIGEKNRVITEIRYEFRQPGGPAPASRDTCVADFNPPVIVVPGGGPRF